MILPTKGIAADRALLSVGAGVLRLLDEPKTVSRVWDEMRRAQPTSSVSVTFDWFVLAMDLLCVLGTIDLEKGRLRKVSRASVEDGDPADRGEQVE
ncbi:MAG TPA: ABC-three component system middle component 6 [Candidatus Acidoferrales bacterium]|nr:ABC-three component system middle component 6 [Candidatus Acidoferrales bacterium]